MGRPRSRSPRFVRLGRTRQVLDADTGLVWEVRPAERPVTWAAAADQAGRGWRLPTISELMRLLGSLPANHPFTPPGADALFWSSTESPFAARGLVRAVACQGPLFVVRLLDKRARARAWRVRDAASDVEPPAAGN